MAKIVPGLFDSAAEARLVVDDLVAAGCRREDISLVAKDERTTESSGFTADAGIGAALGGPGGVSVGLGALAIPGIGPIVTAGPITARLVGAAGGAAAGGLIGGLVGLGIPEEEEAHAYAEGVRRGKILVIAKTADVAVGTATDVMTRHHPIDVHSGSTQWRRAEEPSTVGKRAVEGDRRPDR